MRSNRITATLIGLFTLGFVAALAHAYDVTWRTIDGGGLTTSTGGAFSLSGTIGQPDAGGMSGGAFTISGGYWPGVEIACTCPGDMNADGLKNGADIQKFVNCMTGGGSCACADVDAVMGVTIDDLAVFAADLLSGGMCP